VRNEAQRPTSHIEEVNVKVFAQRLVGILFYPAFFIVVCAPAVPVLGVTEMFAFASLALAWFVFGRLLVLVYLASAFRTRASLWIVQAIGSSLVDIGGVTTALWFDSRLIWSVLGAVVITEIVFRRDEATATP
jgi:hypothetical protein